MRQFRPHRPSPSMAVALSALVLSGTASASAALLVTGANIKNGTVTSVDIANGGIARADLSVELRRLLADSASDAGSSRASVDVQAGSVGPVGPIGPIGPVGPRGETGAQGAQGPAGRSPVLAQVGVSALGINLGDLGVDSVLRLATGVYRVALDTLGGTCVKVATPISTQAISLTVSTPVTNTIEVRARDAAGTLVNTAFDLAVLC